MCWDLIELVGPYIWYSQWWWLWENIIERFQMIRTIMLSYWLFLLWFYSIFVIVLFWVGVAPVTPTEAVWFNQRPQFFLATCLLIASLWRSTSSWQMWLPCESHRNKGCVKPIPVSNNWIFHQRLHKQAKRMTGGGSALPQCELRIHILL